MPKVKIADIIIDDRVREDLGDDYEQLRDSINSRGLINRVIVNKKDSSLVDGFRRLSCCKELEWKEIEVKFYEDLSPLEKALIELEANLHKTLTWNERAKLRAKIHRLNQELHGKAVKRHDVNSLGQKIEGWGLEDTAKLLNISPATLSQDIGLSQDIKDFPELVDIQTRRQALKAVNRIQEVAILSQLAKIDAEEAPDSQVPYTMFHGDAIKIVKEKIGDETIDLVVFDPPWGIGINEIASARGIKGEKTSYEDDSEETAVDLATQLLPELYRVMKEDAHMYMFIGIQYKDFYIDLLTNYTVMQENLRLWKRIFPQQIGTLKELEKELKAIQKLRSWKFHVEVSPLIWVKEGGGFTDFDHKFMPRYEALLFCSKGIKKQFNDAVSNVFEVNRPLTTERIHTQEKPIELIQRFIKISTQPNEIVLDPCAGSFSTTIAATLTKRRSIAIESDEMCYAKGLARVSGLLSDNEPESPPETPFVDKLKELTAKGYKELDPGSVEWKYYWDSNPDEQEEMLAWKKDKK